MKNKFGRRALRQNHRGHVYRSIKDRNKAKHVGGGAFKRKTEDVPAGGFKRNTKDVSGGSCSG